MAAMSAQKPPIAPKSDAVKLLAEKRKAQRPLQRKYVQQMKHRFECFSHSTGNVNYVSPNFASKSDQNRYENHDKSAKIISKQIAFSMVFTL